MTTQNTAAKPRIGFSGNQLKIFASVIMLIDHSAYALIPSLINIGAADVGMLVEIYNAMRLIGRLAFPIYCFLLVEGFKHTRSAEKYLVRLLIFAAVSEVPFDMVFRQTFFSIEYQNVYFTLALGLAAMLLLSKVKLRIKNAFARELLCALIAALFIAAGYYSHCDYGAFGVAAIIFMYALRNVPLWQAGAGVLVFAWEKSAPLAFVPILLYNGKRGRNRGKYFFYVFYPLHLLLLCGIRALILSGLI